MRRLRTGEYVIHAETRKQGKVVKLTAGMITIEWQNGVDFATGKFDEPTIMRHVREKLLPHLLVLRGGDWAEVVPRKVEQLTLQLQSGR